MNARPIRHVYRNSRDQFDIDVGLVGGIEWGNTLKMLRYFK